MAAADFNRAICQSGSWIGFILGFARAIAVPVVRLPRGSSRERWETESTYRAAGCGRAMRAIAMNAIIEIRSAVEITTATAANLPRVRFIG